MATGFGKLARTPVGQIALQLALAPQLPEPFVQSFVVSGARRTLQSGLQTVELYPPHYSTDGSPIDNVRVAFKHEPLDLRNIHAALRALRKSALEAWVRHEPTTLRTAQRGKYFGEGIAHLRITCYNPNHYLAVACMRRHRVCIRSFGGSQMTVQSSQSVNSAYETGPDGAGPLSSFSLLAVRRIRS